MNRNQDAVSFSSVKSLDIFPGLNYHVHRLADHTSKNGKRAILPLSFLARPADHIAKSIALGFLIPFSHGDAILCSYKNKSRVKLAARVVILTPVQIPRIPIECTLYFFGYGAKDAILNIPSTLAGFINPDKKVQAYFLKRYLRESNPDHKIMNGLKRDYQLRSFDHDAFDVYKTITILQYGDYDQKKAYHQKLTNRLKLHNPPYNRGLALSQQITFKIFSY